MDYVDIFNIAVIGKKESIIRMLNAAIRNVAGGAAIADEDDIEVMNRKIKEEDGRNGIEIYISDLFDDASMQDAGIQEKKRIYDNKLKFARECQGCPQEECPFEIFPKDCPKQSDFTEIARDYEVVSIEKSGNDYIANFSRFVGELLEGCIYPYWADWDDIARAYHCRIYEDDKEYIGDDLLKYCYTRYIEPEGDGVKDVRYESGDTVDEYEAYLDKIVELNSDRYISVRDEYRDRCEN